MNEKIDKIAAFPVNDRKVFFKKNSGVIFERAAVIVKYLENENNPFCTIFANEDGWVMSEDIRANEDCMDIYDELGKVGDTIVPHNLSRAIDVCLKNRIQSIDDVFDIAGDYFKIDWDSAPDTVKIRITVNSDGSANFLCKSEWYGFPEIKGVNLNHPEFKAEWGDLKYDLRETLVEPLEFYSRYLDKPIGLDIDFDNFYDIDCYYEIMDDEIQLRNDEIDIYRRKYLSKIREYISSEFVKVRNEWKVSPEVLAHRKAVREKYEYANQDRIVMPLPTD